jgi:hypothetical protein
MTLKRGHRLDAYRCEEGTFLIEIRLREMRQLFNTLDPAPFHEKDLDPAAEEYIVSGVREVGAHPSRLVLHLPPGTTGDEARGAVTAIRNYFTYRSRQVREQLRLLFVRGVISLLIGWVAMWKPVEIFLYDWWPEFDKKRLFEQETQCVW